MAPQKTQSKRTPSPASSYASSSEDEPENQAKPSQAPLKVPDGASHKRPPSSSEDDTDESSDDSTSEKLDDKEPPSTKRPPQKQAKVVAISSDSESKSKSISDRENYLPPPVQRESRNREPSVKPTVSKPVSDGAASSKKRKPAEVASRSENKEGKNQKRGKVSEAAPFAVSKEGNNEAPRKRFQRLWSLKDEIILLSAVVTFKKKHGREPACFAEYDSLYGTTKLSFDSDFSMSQFRTKLENLKKKYSRLLAKGQLPKDKTPDARAAFDLGKEIWGEKKKNKSTVIDGGVPNWEMKRALENGGQAKLAGRLSTPFEKSKGDGVKSCPSSLNQLGSISEGDDTGSSILDFVANQFNWIGQDSLKQSFALLDHAECKVIEEIWNCLMLREMEFQIQRLEAAKEIIKVLKDKMAS